jgi:hypothetical protein
MHSRQVEMTTKRLAILAALALALSAHGGFTGYFGSGNTSASRAATAA